MKKFKIFFNEPLKETPYGGAAHFVSNMVNYLKEEFEITYQLENNIDLIIIVSNSTYKYKEKTKSVLKYKKKNPKVKILHRINNCDKRKNTKNVDKLILRTNRFANKTVFVSKWLANYFLNKGFKKSYHVIYNGCNPSYFYPEKDKEIGEVITLVTHHWSNSWMKGFDIYNKIDRILDKRKDFNFTYIGNYNPEYIPKNIKLIPPLYGEILGNELRKCDIYLTASRWEPGGNHYVEGASCGLPVLYHKDGGGVNETCNRFGLLYHNIPSLLDSIEKIKKYYQEFRDKIPYKFLSSERCSQEYYDLIKDMLK